MVYRSKHIDGLRGFIARLDEAGELIRVQEEVDWKFEIGERTRSAKRSRSGNRAMLFERIKGYPDQKVFTNGLGCISRIAISLGLSATASYREVVKVVVDRIGKPIPPTVVNRLSCEEWNLSHEAVDLALLPVPWWNREDAGRYIGTWHLNITRDPETGERNVGVYRMQLIGRNQTYISVSPKSHFGRQLGVAEKRGRPLEMAVAIGVDEPTIMAAAAAVPYGVDEIGIAGGLLQRPVEVRKCQTIDLEVPVNAEIILEGRIQPGVRGIEGPFLDYAGIPKGNPKAPVFEVSCMECKKHPIFRGALVGEAGAEDHLLYSLLASAGCLDFHGSRTRQVLQNMFLRFGYFRIFQHLGVLGQKARDMYGKTRGS